MKLAGWLHIVDVGSFVATPQFALVERQIEEGISSVHWPPTAGEFKLNPTAKGNGVRPIKDAFITSLRSHGWRTEHETFDAHCTFASGSSPFVVEWETGNISSSHRAVNRIAKGILERRIIGGVLIVPTGAMYPYLTDRVGNLTELERYFGLWRTWSQVEEFQGGYLGIVSVEHDLLDTSVPLIAKGTDGRALL